MKTYAEKCGKKPFDWFAELRKRQSKSLRPLSRLSQLAKQWPTCACGVQCEAIPRNRDGCPDDSELVYRGLEFASYVTDGRWSDAIRTLKVIEHRSGVLLQRMRTANKRRTPKKKPVTRRKKK